MNDTKRDRVAAAFDEWAINDRHKILEEGHQFSVHTMLDLLQEKKCFNKPFSFLDVGCGNGWVVRYIAANKEHCTRASGIDISPTMIDRAQEMQEVSLEEYHVMAIEEWDTSPFDLIFSMESIYYTTSMPRAISQVYSLLVPGGMFVCGTDYYTENQDTAYWGDSLDITMHMHTESEWIDMFRNAGFQTSFVHVRDPNSPVRWKREQGTLFVIGVRPDDAHTK